MDPRDKLIHKILIRSAVRPEWVDCMLIPNDNVLKHGKILVASVLSLDMAGNSATLSNGSVLHYDFCVIATGASSKAPVEPPIGIAPHEYFNNVAYKIAHSKHIMLVGGGPVAIELAGEIKDKHPNTSVTLVSSAETLCSNMNFPLDASEKIVKTLKGLGVDVILNRKVDLEAHANESLIIHSPAKSYGEHLENVDLVVNCTGFVPNTRFLPMAVLNAKGQVIVNEFLQVKENVFAIGDCTDVAEAKNFVNVCGKDFMQGMPLGHSDIVAANIRAMTSESPLTAYVPNKWVSGIIPCGPKASVTLGLPEEYGVYKSAAYFYQAQFSFAKASKVPEAPAL